jgi:hypothetical protein
MRKLKESLNKTETYKSVEYLSISINNIIIICFTNQYLSLGIKYYSHVKILGY